MGRFFDHKLTGAQASLFAEACRQYSEYAELESNDAAPAIPIFSWLSPQQRIRLVREVAVGLLCPKEPLPPDTMHHYAAYLAIFEMLDGELDMEVQDGDTVGDDLIEEYYDKNPPPPPRSRTRTPEELIEYEIEYEQNRLLVNKAATKGVKKLNRASTAAAGQQEGEEEKEFTVPTGAPADTMQEMVANLEDSTTSRLFAGGRCTDEQRHPPRPLTRSEEKSGFRFRLLCDAAFQQDAEIHPAVACPPLCMVDFCWTCFDESKWSKALSILRFKMNPVQPTPTEHALLTTPIEEVTYADVSKHAHIRSVGKVVDDLRSTFDSSWTPMETGMDQRCIFAVCAKELFWGNPGHGDFCHDFHEQCQARGFELDSDGDHYQKRFEIFQSMDKSKKYIEGLDTGYHYSTPFENASEYEADKGMPKKRCNKSPWCSNHSVQEKDLMLCSRCKVAWYCSTEHQREDWANHKKICKYLAQYRKDKEKMKEVVEKFQS